MDRQTDKGDYYGPQWVNPGSNMIFLLFGSSIFVFHDSLESYVFYIPKTASPGIPTLVYADRKIFKSVGLLCFGKILRKFFF